MCLCHTSRIFGLELRTEKKFVHQTGLDANLTTVKFLRKE